MEPGMIITAVALIFMIVVLVILLKTLGRACRNLRNTIRGYMGKDPAEMVKATAILHDHEKNNMIPSWFLQDAINVLQKATTRENALEVVAEYVQRTGLKGVEFPKAMYLAPGSSKEQLENLCNSYFAKFNFKKMEKNDSMTEKDFETMRNLAYGWFFADNGVSTYQEAFEAVRGAFGSYCEKNGSAAV